MLEAWPYYVDVAIQSAKIDADLTDFVTVVNGSDLPAGFWTYVVNGGELRVSDPQETTEYPRQVAHFDAVGETMRLIVRKTGVTSSTSNTTLRIHLGNTGASDYAATDPYGSEAVWVNAVFAVTLGANDYNDKSATGATVVSNGSDLDSDSEVYDGKWATFVPNEGLHYSDEAACNLGNDYCTTMWARLNADGGSGYAYFFCKGRDLNPTFTNGLAYQNSINKYYCSTFYNATQATPVVYSTTTDTPVGNVRFLAHSFSPDRKTSIWVDGVKEATSSAAPNDADNTCDVSQGLQFGRMRTYYHYLTGNIDLMVMWKTELSSAFMLALYRNRDTATFYSVGALTVKSSFVPEIRMI